MKILMVHSTEKVSGGENVSLGIADCLRGVFDFVFFAPAKPVSMERFVGYGVFYPKGRGFMNLLRELKEVINSERPDIVHAQGARAALFTKMAFIEGAHRAKFVYTLHGIHFVRKKFPRNFISLLIERFAGGLIDALVCVGEDDLELARTLHLAKNDKLFLIENGVKVEGVGEEDKRRLREELSLGGEKIIVTVCRLHYQKDVETLIRAIDLLRDRNVRLLVVGDGPKRRELEELSKSLDLGGAVDFLGNRNDTEVFLSIADIFVLSTNWEGQPLVVLEAWARKKPVVVSNVHGVKDIVQDGENGLLFQHKNPDDLSRKIAWLFDNENAGARMGENGYRLVRSKYTVEIMAGHYGDLYLKLTND
jgi:glycosyltransferase involved in cell wall biosynthesis